MGLLRIANNFINEIICDHVKIFIVAAWTSCLGVILKFTNVILSITPPIIDSNWEHFITTNLMWLSFCSTFGLFLMAVFKKCKSWYTRKKLVKEANKRHRHTHYDN